MHNCRMAMPRFLKVGQDDSAGLRDSFSPEHAEQQDFYFFHLLIQPWRVATGGTTAMIQKLIL